MKLCPHCGSAHMQVWRSNWVYLRDDKPAYPYEPSDDDDHYFCGSCCEPVSTPVELPELKERRPLDDDDPDGYQESDRDYVMNNLELVLALLRVYEWDTSKPYVFEKEEED